MRVALLSASAVVLLASLASAAPKTWEFAGGGQWPQVNSPSTSTQPDLDPTLDRVQKLIDSHSNRAAASIAIRWLKTHKSHPQRDRALFLVARALYQYGDRIKAFYYLDELLDENPDSQLYYSALQWQFRIAESYLNGYKRRFLMIPAFHAQEEAVEMLYRIQQRSPGSPLAEKALLRTGDYYFNDRQYDLAADTYTAFIRNYPRSPLLPYARLRQAYSSYAQFRGPRFDATPLLDAREQLRDIERNYPDLAADENVSMLIERIDRTLALKLWLTADFYRRTHEPRGAVYTYRYLAKAFPDSPEAAKAQAALRRMPQSALNSTIEPGNVSLYGPGSTPLSTQPAREILPGLPMR